MTVSTEVNHEQYVGNGVTTVFPYRFRILKSSHMLVTVSDSAGVIKILTAGTDYSITGTGLVSGGSVTLNSPLAQGWGISLDRKLPAVQETDLRNQGRFFAETHEDAFDYLTMLIQQVDRQLSYLALRKPNSLVDFYDALNQRISNLSRPVENQDAVNKQYADEISSGAKSYTDSAVSNEADLRIDADLMESLARAQGDANIQQQLTGNIPLEASAFSPVSWHRQVINNSIVIPDNMNAWSFGPVMELAPGQQITIPAGSFWTIADGQRSDSSGLDFGQL
ncbi:hypothetical protein ACR3LR_08565 [Pantoea eucalypti]|uniref:hypothetical protein n=1 Tax=Pantoea eucalypti TaxID=470933 RepID=UPI003EE4AC5D